MTSGNNRWEKEEGIFEISGFWTFIHGLNLPYRVRFIPKSTLMLESRLSPGDFEVEWNRKREEGIVQETLVRKNEDGVIVEFYDKRLHL